MRLIISGRVTSGGIDRGKSQTGSSRSKLSNEASGVAEESEEGVVEFLVSIFKKKGLVKWIVEVQPMASNQGFNILRVLGCSMRQCLP